MLLFLDFNDTVDLHLHDTYYIVPTRLVIMLAVFVLLFFWVFYLVARNLHLSTMLTWVHVITTIIVVIFLFAFPFLLGIDIFSSTMPRRYYYIGQEEMREPIIRQLMIRVVFLIMLIAGQLAFLINVMKGLYKRVFK